MCTSTQFSLLAFTELWFGANQPPSGLQKIRCHPALLRLTELEFGAHRVTRAARESPSGPQKRPAPAGTDLPQTASLRQTPYSNSLVKRLHLEVAAVGRPGLGVVGRKLDELAQRSGTSKHDAVLRAIDEEFNRMTHRQRVTDALNQTVERWGDALERLGQ